MLFSDDFNRANGAIGNNWSVGYGTFTIDGNAAACDGFGYATNPGAAASGNQRAWIILKNTGNGFQNAHPIIKVSANFYQFYYCTLGFGAGSVTIQLYKQNYPSAAQLAEQSFTYSPGSTVKLTMAYLDGVVSATVDDTHTVSASDSAYSGNTGAGMGFGDSPPRVDSFTADEGVTASIQVTPDPLWVGGGPQQLTVTGSGTAWTAGVPGSSTVTVDHGAISDQWTASATTIHLTYTPDEYVGALTFTESEYGAQDVVNATLDPSAGGGTGVGQLSANALAYLEFSASRGGWGIQNTAAMIGTAPIDTTFIEAIRHIYQFTDFYYPQGEPASGPIDVTKVAAMAAWDALNGGVAQPQGLYSPTTDQPVKLDTEQLLAAVKAATVDGDYNLATVISQIAGSDGYNLTTLLANMPTTDTQPIVDELAAIRGDTTTSLYTLLSSLAGIRTIDALSLRDVLQAIDALPKTLDGGYGLGDRAANAAGFVAVLLAIAGMAATEAEDAAVSTATGAGVLALAATLAEVAAQLLGLLNEIKSLLGGGENQYRAPVWPGLAHVEFGAPTAIEANVPVVGQMHGVRVAIIGCEGGTRFFGYDGIPSYSHVGALAFGNDQGDLEPFQVLGPNAAFYTPTRMTEAFTCRLYRSRNVKGTITPWKIVS